jgi:hypothetical protein
MNAAFLALPEWLRVPFLPMRDTLTILFDKEEDALARQVINAIPQPAGWTVEQLAEFDSAKGAILSSIDALIADVIANDPNLTPESRAYSEEAAARREAQWQQ